MPAAAGPAVSAARLQAETAARKTARMVELALKEDFELTDKELGEVELEIEQIRGAVAATVVPTWSDRLARMQALQECAAHALRCHDMC